MSVRADSGECVRPWLHQEPLSLNSLPCGSQMCTTGASPKPMWNRIAREDWRDLVARHSPHFPAEAPRAKSSPGLRSSCAFTQNVSRAPSHALCPRGGATISAGDAPEDEVVQAPLRARREEPEEELQRKTKGRVDPWVVSFRPRPSMWLTARTSRSSFGSLLIGRSPDQLGPMSQSTSGMVVPST